MYLASATLRSFRHSCRGRPPSLTAALVIARLYPASLQRSVSSPGPKRPLAPTELHGYAHDSYPSFRFSIFVFLRFLRLCCSRCLLLCLSHDRGVVKSFCVDNCEVKAHVRQFRVSPCIHVDPWLREFLCCKRRSNHLPLRFEPCFAARVVNDVASHIVQLCSVPPNEASLRMLSLFVKMSQAPGSWSKSDFCCRWCWLA